MEDLLGQFRKDLEYDYWANDRYVKALSEMPEPPTKAVKILGHIVFASDVWLARLEGRDLFRFTDPNPDYPLEVCGKMFGELREGWARYLGSLSPADLERKFVYANTQGKRFEQVARNVIVQVVTHSHYHRGQLAVLVHESGGKRPGTDYILYAFEKGEAKQL